MSTPPQYAVERLAGGGSVDPAVLGSVFRAGWRGVAVVRLGPGETLGPRRLDASEAMVFITAGSGRARMDHGPVDLREGIALTLFKGELLELQADDGLEAFVAEIAAGG